MSLNLTPVSTPFSLFEKFLLGLCAVLLVTNGLTGYLFNRYFDKYNDEVKAHVESNATYKVQTQEMLASIDSCTESVADLKKASDERSIMAKKEVDQARSQMKQFKKSAQYWQDAAKNIPAKSCPEGNELINEYLEKKSK